MSRDADYTADVLVIGAGAAGLRAALAACQQGATVLVVAKGAGCSVSLTGMNVPLGHADPADGPSAFYEDTLRAGMGLNDRRLVQAMAYEAQGAMADLERLGVPFVRRDSGYAQRLASGSSHPRTVYGPQDIGKDIVRCLREACRQQGVTLVRGVMVYALLHDQRGVVGAGGVEVSSGRWLTLAARAVVLAAGGLGQLYDFTSYPRDLGGDGVALAYRAGAAVQDMEFVQFEPLAVLFPAKVRGKLMPTMLLGDGAPLLNARGERFMFRHGPTGERQVPKYVLCQAIAEEVAAGRGFPHGGVHLDTAVLPAEVLDGYPDVERTLRSAGLDFRRQPVEVGPTAHTQCGGVVIDADGQTGVPGLFAGGEVACSVHGADRMAGSGGTDVLVFGHRAGLAAAAYALAKPAPTLPEEATAREEEHVARLAESKEGVEPAALKQQIQRTMSAHAGLIRTGEGLQQGLERLAELKGMATSLRVGGPADLAIALEAENMLLVAEMVLRSALARTESRGCHRRADFPQPDDRWLQNLVIRRGPEGDMMLKAHAVKAPDER